MKIGVVVDNELNNDKRVLRETEILREGGHEINVLCFGFGKTAYNGIDGISITRIRINKRIKNTLFFFLNLMPLYELLWSSAIKKFILKNSIEVLHVHDLYMSKAAASGIRKSGKQIPMVLDLHENYSYAVTTYNWTKGTLRSLISQPLKWKAKEKEYLGYADRLIVLSEEFRDTLIERYPGIPATRFLPLPNVPDLAQMGSREPVTLKVNIMKDSVTLLYYGVVAERRGIFDALDIVSELADEGHPSVFLVIGPVDRKDRSRFFNIINREQLRAKVFYIPWIDNSELHAYLEIADICLAPFHRNPQHESGVANKIYDYMLGRKPVIASDCKPQKKLIEKYNCGIIFTDKKELKAAIKKLSADPALRLEMGKNGFNAIVNDHNMGMIKERLLLMYSNLQNAQQSGLS
jgi:glycosyltransferase involved in cell wall biosynthesis